ncbi:MAG: thioesterase family protein [Candidatus Nanopelagicales bacterium]
MTTIELDGRWHITGHLNGGYLAAVCGQAASEVLDGATPLTISTHYLAPARGGGPAEVEVEVIRRGRLSTARVRLSRDKLILESMVTAGSPAGEGHLEDADVPDIPAWADCVDTGSHEAADVPGMEVLKHVELRLDPAHAQAIAGGPALDRAVVHGRLAYRDGSPADVFLVSAAWDLLPPTPWFTHVWGQLPTVAAQVVLYPGELVGPLVLEARCDTLRDGIADETSRVWDATGRLVASARQTAVLVKA